MKKYFVISHLLASNSHINVQDLLPASCKLITGIAVNVTAKQEGQLENTNVALPFPQNLIQDLLTQEPITELFYSYLRTRSSELESRAYFEMEMLPQIAIFLSQSIIYPCLEAVEQEDLTERIENTLTTGLGDYLYDFMGLYQKGATMTTQSFAEAIIQSILGFLHFMKETIFWKDQQVYVRPQPYDCGNISLLVNGNSFLLRDYGVIANRKVKHMSKEIIPFYEPLEINSTIHTVFKSRKKDENNQLRLRIYIEYEHE